MNVTFVIFLVLYFGSQVEQNRVKLLNDQAVAKSQLQKKLGQFLYLTNLEKVTFYYADMINCITYSSVI